MDGAYIYNNPCTFKNGNTDLFRLVVAVTTPQNRLPYYKPVGFEKSMPRHLIEERERKDELSYLERLPQHPIAGMIPPTLDWYCRNVSEEEIAIILAKIGQTAQAIASFFDVNERTIRRWQKDYLGKARDQYLQEFTIKTVPLLYFEECKRKFGNQSTRRHEYTGYVHQKSSFPPSHR